MTVARLVDRLEELGLVKRCADPKNGACGVCG